MFAERLNKLRKDRGLTAQKMADSLGIGVRNYRKYESGDAKPTVDGIALIADLLDVSVDYLLEVGIYGKLSEHPAVKPLLAELIDGLLGEDTLSKTYVHSVIDLADADFCQLAASLIKNFTFDDGTLEIFWRFELRS